MDETTTNENPAPQESGLNKIDLSQLQGFSFGTQWLQTKGAAHDEKRGSGERPRRDDRREAGAPDRRDRRSFRKPQGPVGEASDAGAPARGAAPAPREGGERREFRGGPRRDFRSGPRSEGGERGEPRGARYGQGAAPQDRGPYESPYFTVTFYPEDASFATLAKTVRSSCRTIELFEIARTVIGKPDRFVVVVQRKAAPKASAPAEGQTPGVKPAPLFISVPDGLPFETEDAAITHVLREHLGQFFDTAEVEVEAPKGNYQVINRCGITGELLGPPNYHRYNQIVQQHFAARINRMPFEVFRGRIESVRDPEVVNQWLEKMKKVTRYTWKLDRPAAAAVPAEVPAEAGAAEAAAPVAASELTFDSLEDARVHLLTHARDKVVRTAESARFHGRAVEAMAQSEIRRAIEGTWERQQRFPLDTANALRGRLRREGFTIFKKGSKGVSYVCAVKRKFRVPGQTFAESINALISFIEAHPMVKVSDLPQKHLGIDLPEEPKEKPAATTEAPAEGAGEAAAPAAAAALTPEAREKIVRMQGDLRWLVREGYVTEFIDGRVFAPPPMVEARKKEVESEEHDPENFPEVPAETTAPATVAPSEDAPEAKGPETSA
ncbi:MAG TPA: hypothetical protein PKY36_09750 [Opitutaceae bacterium]|nr:hypothetical protein [Opitutaceae bacterium]